MDYAKIIVHHNEIALGRYERTYEWVGDISAPVILNCPIEEIPFPLKYLETDYTQGDKYIRTDAKYWRFTLAKIKIHNALSWINNRLIMTAHVWGLVYVEVHSIMTWEDAIAKKWKAKGK